MTSKFALILILIVAIQSFSVTRTGQKYINNCEECKQRYEACLNSGNLHCVDNCQYTCGQADLAREGKPTYAEEKASMSLDAILRSSQFRASLTGVKKQIFLTLLNVVHSEIMPQIRQRCFQENQGMFYQGMNDNFMLNLCISEKTLNLSRNGMNGPGNFYQIVNSCNIPEEYHNFANQCLLDISSNVTNDLLLIGAQ
jgi:hypothetical protein